MKWFELPASRLAVGSLVLFSRMIAHHYRRSFDDSSNGAFHRKQARAIEERRAGLVVPILAIVIHVHKLNQKGKKKHE